MQKCEPLFQPSLRCHQLKNFVSVFFTATVDFIKSSPAAAQADANAELGSYTGKPLKASIVAAAFKEITFTVDPDASSLTSDAKQAESLGLLKPVNLNGIFDLTPLNTALSAAGEAQVSS